MKLFKKYKQPIIKITVLSLSGCLLIFGASRYVPVSIPGYIESEVLIPETNQLQSNTSEHFTARVTKRWNAILDQLSASLMHLSMQAEETSEYKPSVLKYNLISLFPEGDEIEVDQSSISSIINNPSQFLNTMLKPLYKNLNISVKNKTADSYGGQMFELLNRKDAEWTSALYKWIQATPEQAAAMKSLPSSAVVGSYNPVNPLHIKEDPATWLIPSWKNVTINFFDGDDKQINLYSNTQAILSMASVNTYYTGWQNLDDFKTYINRLWETSHSYTTTISDVYYCDGCESPVTDSTATAESAVNAVLESQSDISYVEGDNTSKKASTVPQETTVSSEPLAVVSSDSISGAVLSQIPETTQISETSQTPETTAVSGSDGTLARESTVSEAAAAKVTGPATVGAVSTGDTSTGNTSVREVFTGDVAIQDPALMIQLNEEGKFCPGHVDLIVNAKITGLSEKNNLFGLDNTPPVPWTPYRINYVNQLLSQDWKENYDLSTMELGIGKPLTASEIGAYMSLLPPDLSTERRAVIAYALNSVGKIPYYYGGKPHTTGYEDNHFSSPVRPDQKGRILSGLDCSGWINWVYWSAVGKKLTSLGTSGLIHEGTAINKAELKPGDIIVKPGLESHVVMFLSWASDGSIICIHETGGSTNNVTVSTLTSEWPYYRAIMD